ncbi:protein-glutamate O-methyltransferase CheR [Acidiferrimicrobium sp. IK]|uniref:CheR family methyltransferase n=1 Tax=Acidiferrimicrobium sp. IK TaxID=2871700 RepID=UPI0021CB2F1F|nr:protein-glutamate O-methyltransferase CheR [Acidiferrimicrobium sp. IK]MCU4182817.1 protein-glutamate O-methyltransferase CheR [Acidiferrimicrobium sp. IK]
MSEVAVGALAARGDDLATLTHAEAAFVRTLVRAHAAIVLDESKSYLIERRLAPVARDTGAGSVSELVASLRSSPRPQLRDLVVDALTTNETSWFRDRHPFDALQHHVLPPLIDARRANRTLTVWCGAASTGQEPFSLAILIREHFPELSSWNVRIVATDISRTALEQARSGLYGQIEINRGMHASYISRYFQRDGTKFRLDNKIRSMVEFRELNLVGPWTGVPRSDLVLLRNVMIYFDPATKTQILHKIATDVLRPDGVLILGGAETTLNLTDEYTRVQKGTCGWYQRKAAG